MIETRQGDLLDIETGIIVHGCNSLGVMGAGIANQVRIRFPEAYQRYIEEYRTNGLFPGNVTWVNLNNNYDKWIVNAITQASIGSGRQNVSYYAIEACFIKVNKMARHIEEVYGKKLDICFPKIGAGLGGGDWDTISDIIDNVISNDFNKILYIL